jgi:hypothetical protein
MRYVSSLPPVTTGPNTRQVGGLMRIHAVKPIQTGEQTVPTVENKTAKLEPEPLVGQLRQRAEPFEDRRKACRRVSRQTVLVELRSGPDRRRRNLRENDLVDHIDEIV